MISPLNLGSVQSSFRSCKKLIQKDDLPEPLWTFTIQTNGCLNCRTSPGLGRPVTRLSPWYTLYIPKRNRQMVMQSASLEEGYSIPLVLRFRQFIYCPTCPPLAFDLVPRVCFNNGFNLFQIRSTDYLEIHQFWGVIILSDTLYVTYSFLAFIGDHPVCINFGPPDVYSVINSDGFSSDCKSPSLSPVTIGQGSTLGWININESVSQ